MYLFFPLTCLSTQVSEQETMSALPPQAPQERSEAKKKQSRDVSSGDETKNHTAAVMEVTGYGVIEQDVDKAILSFGVEVISKKVDSVMRQLRNIVANIALIRLDDHEIQLETGNLTIQEKDEYVINSTGVSERKKLGYIARQSIQFIFSEKKAFEQIDSIIDQVIATGGDSIRLDGITYDAFYPMHLTVLKKASNNMRHKAITLADVNRVLLGPLIFIKDSIVIHSGSRHSTSNMRSMSLEAGSSQDIRMPIMPGKKRTHATVSGIYQIGPLQ